MKKMLFFVPLLFLGCSKDDGKDVVDCIGQSLFADVHHTNEGGTNVNLNVSYKGSHTLKNTITWDYGDGKVETVNGTTTSHTYAQPGSYKVKASVSLVSPDCTFEVKEDVTVN